MDARRQRRRLLHGDAGSVHPGVDVQCRPTAPAAAGDECIPLGQFAGAIDDRMQGIFRERLRRAGHNAIEHVNRRVRRYGSESASLGHVGDEERSAAGLDELARDRLETAAISIRLEHGGAFDRNGNAGKLLPVRFDCIEVDAQDATRLGCAGGRWCPADGPQVTIVNGHDRAYGRVGCFRPVYRKPMSGRFAGGAPPTYPRSHQSCSGN